MTKSEKRGDCAYCGKFTQLTKDHVIPKCRKTKNIPKILLLVCMPCNKDKADKSLEQWINTLLGRSNKWTPQAIYSARFLYMKPSQIKDFYLKQLKTTNAKKAW